MDFVFTKRVLPYTNKFDTAGRQLRSTLTAFTRFVEQLGPFNDSWEKKTMQKVFQQFDSLDGTSDKLW